MFEYHLLQYYWLAMSGKGKLNVGEIILVYIPLIILTPFYSYYKAVSQHQEKPFPAATITQTACHYPQDIVFRYFMLIASSLLALIFFMMFRWAQSVANDVGFPKQVNNTLYYFSLFSIVLYGITIGTIDEKGTGPLHSPCAVGFFLILIWSIINMTLYLTQLRDWKHTTISRTSLRCKQFLAIYLIVLWVYCIGMIIIVSLADSSWESKTDKYVNIVEWNTVTVGLLWVLTWVWEWKQMNLVLVFPNSDNSYNILQNKRRR